MTFGRSLSSQEKINFTRHLAIIIKAGLPLLEGLKIIRRQTGSKLLLSIIDKIIVDINNGQSLASALRKYPKVFGGFYVSVVEVGEVSGTLAPNLLYLADEMKKSRALRGKVRSAMIYPTILFIMTVVVTSFLTFYIFPKLLGAFSGLGIGLPVTTRILIAILTFLRTYLLYIIAGAILLAIGIRFLLKVASLRYRWDSVMLSIPVAGTLIINTNVADLSRMLGLLLKSGVKIVEAMTIVSQTSGNMVYKRSLQNAAEEVKRGGSLAQYFSKHRRVFPVILTAMVEVGENTGNLEDNLFYLSEYYTEEVDTSLRDLTSLVEPLILIVMGLVVGFVALSIITPIYSITQGLSK